MRKTKLLTKEEIVKLSICDVVAITGPMAAGKNYICSQLEEKDFISIDADKVAHEAIEKATDKILEAFKEDAKARGINIKNEDGSLNRRALGSIVFSDKNLLKKQESIVYPIITNLIDDFINQHPDKKIIINATVLYKIPYLMEKCEIILFVTAPFFTRLKRAKKRDRLPVKQILARFKAQKDLFNEYQKSGKEIIIVTNKNH